MNGGLSTICGNYMDPSYDEDDFDTIEEDICEYLRKTNCTEEDAEKILRGYFDYGLCFRQYPDTIIQIMHETIGALIKSKKSIDDVLARIEAFAEDSGKKREIDKIKDDVILSLLSREVYT